MLDPLQFWAGVSSVLGLVAGASVWIALRTSSLARGIVDVKLHAQKAREAQRETLRHELAEGLREHREESDKRYATAAQIAKIETDVGWMRGSLERIERAVTGGKS
jgi:septal ring factor EnvC (AmiA/AmiB activator)